MASVGKSLDFILTVVGQLLEGTVHWLVLGILSAIVFASWRDAAQDVRMQIAVRGRDEGKEGGGSESRHPYSPPSMRAIQCCSPLSGAQGNTKAGASGWGKLPSCREHLVSPSSLSSRGPRWQQGLSSPEISSLP